MLLAALSVPSAAFADAILPSLFIVWPVTILLFVPVVLIEAIYVQIRLRTGFWRLAAVTTVANLLSAAVGLPIASAISAGFKYALEALKFRNADALRAREAQLGLDHPGSVGPHDSAMLIWLGAYPIWIMILSAIVMLAACYLISWWIEGRWLQRHFRRAVPEIADKCMGVAKVANLLSYAFVALVVVAVLIYLWPSHA